MEGAGQFAVRGGIIDIYPAQNASPLRIELWGDTVDTLSTFDVLSQRRTDSLETVDIPPAAEVFYDSAELAARIEALANSLSGKRAAAVRENLMQDVDRLRGGARPAAPDKYLPLIYEQEATVFDYADGALVFVSEMQKVRDRIHSAEWQLQEDIKSLLEDHQLCRELCRYQADFDDLTAVLTSRPTLLLETFARSSSELPLGGLYTVSCRQLPVWSGGLDLLCEDLTDLLSRRMACLVLAGSEERAAKALADDLVRRGIPAMFAPSPQKPLRGQVLVLQGGLSAGAEFPESGLALLTHGRASAPRKRRRLNKQKGSEIHSLSELTPGDYIVHAAHGIGLYEGIRQMEVQGVVKDYLKLQYDKGDTLYVPVTQLDLVSKNNGTKDEVKVKLHRLGGQEWQKTKTRVRSAVKDIAKELIRL